MRVSIECTGHERTNFICATSTLQQQWSAIIWFRSVTDHLFTLVWSLRCLIIHASDFYLSLPNPSLFIYLSTYPAIYLWIYPSIYLFIHLFIYLFMYLNTFNLHICLLISLFADLLTPDWISPQLWEGLGRSPSPPYFSIY